MRRPVATEQSALFDDPPANGPADLGWNEQSTRRETLRFDVRPGTPASSCRSCGATVFWIVTPRGRKMPVDGDGTSHFASCPHAAEHRRAR